MRRLIPQTSMLVCLLGCLFLAAVCAMAATEQSVAATDSDRNGDRNNQAQLQEPVPADSTAEGAGNTAALASSDGIVKIGPGFGAYWISANDLAYAEPVYNVRDTYPYSVLLIQKLRWNKDAAGPRRELATIPIGNGKQETAIRFVYESFASQFGYALSNADDRHGSAHGLQVGVIDSELKKPRVYLESSYYHTTGYEEIRGVAMSPDAKGFVVSYKGDLYFIPFGDPGARETASVSSLFRDSYLPYFDDSTIKPRLLRKGGNNYYPAYFSENEMFVYENKDIIVFNPETGSTRPVATVGEDVRGLTLSPDGKRFALIKEGNLLLYRVTGELSETLPLRVPDAQYPSWSPDGRYIAFDDGKSLYVKILEPEAPLAKKVTLPVAAGAATSAVTATADNCNSVRKLINIRLLLEAEIKVLSRKMDPALLEGLREVSKEMNKLISCRSGMTQDKASETQGESGK